MKTNKEICDRFFLAGVAYSDYQKATTLKAGCKLKLFWEKNNKWDDRAIRVEYNGIKLGYIPKGSEAQDIAHEYREHKIKIQATLVAYNKTNPSYRMLTVSLTANKKLPEDKEDSDFYQY